MTSNKNLNPIGFITVRSSSSRLPNKCFLPFGDNETVLSHVIKRSIFYNIEPIVCTSIHKSDDSIELLANDLGVKVFRGSLNNKLKRWLNCAKFFNIDKFHTIDADDPFFDGPQMIKSLNMLNENKFDCICPTKSSSEGDASVGYSLTTDIVEKSLSDISDETDTEMMWYFLERVKGIRMYEMENTNSINLSLRLTLDFEEDYWLLSFIQRLLGTYASREDINNLFSSNPDLAKINLFRNDEWKNAQLSKKI
tara:strand:+ start:241 stop:996 length:756 start_codon:yes stop_codon:yes gene_type:complete